MGSPGRKSGPIIDTERFVMHESNAGLCRTIYFDSTWGIKETSPTLLEVRGVFAESSFGGREGGEVFYVDYYSKERRKWGEKPTNFLLFEKQSSLSSFSMYSANAEALFWIT